MLGNNNSSLIIIVNNNSSLIFSLLFSGKFDLYIKQLCINVNVQCICVCWLGLPNRFYFLVFLFLIRSICVDVGVCVHVCVGVCMSMCVGVGPYMHAPI